MSLATFKKKSIVSQHGTKISGKPPGGFWLRQGPFGSGDTVNSYMIQNNYGVSGFSINGGRRNVGYVGQSMAMGKNGTSFKGVNPVGHGGHLGQYHQGEPVYNSARVNTLGNQYMYIKPSVLSTYGMLRKRYRWAYNGVNPNYWVKNVGGSANLSDNYSSGLYTTNLGTKSDCVVDTNDTEKYVGHIVEHGPFGCSKTNGKGYTFNQSVSNAPYSKELGQPLTSGQYTLKTQRKCLLIPGDPSKTASGKCVNTTSHKK
jgi:hypothetical protein